MSIILDALRSGPGKQAVRQNSSPAQTDAVLQTLGYGRSSPTAPINRSRRALTFAALGVVFAAVLLVAVTWIMRTVLSA
jgi:hypothetical protein